MVENPFEVFTDAVKGISDTKIEPFSGLAKKGLHKLESHRVALDVNFLPPRLPATTFSLYRLPGSEDIRLYPAVVIEAGIVGMGKEVLQADAIRTLAVLDKYPDGYSRRLRTVYGEALDTQVRWLERMEAPKIPLDPRTTDREGLIRALLGPATYDLDAGFKEDWQPAVDLMMRDMFYERYSEKLRELRKAEPDFIIQRYLKQPFLYPHLRYGDGWRQGLSSEEMPQYLCLFIIETFLISRPTRQN